MKVLPPSLVQQQWGLVLAQVQEQVQVQAQHQTPKVRSKHFCCEQKQLLILARRNWKGIYPHDLAAVQSTSRHPDSIPQ